MTYLELVKSEPRLFLTLFKFARIREPARTRTMPANPASMLPNRTKWPGLTLSA